MSDTHARLSASSAKWWMLCPSPVRLEEQFLDSDSEYAVERTLAHSLAGTILRYNNSEVSKKALPTRSNKIKTDSMYSREMQDYIEDCTQRAWEIANEVKVTCPDVRVLFEQRLGISEYVPDGFGTGDVVIVADGMVNIIDLKYGKGVEVSAKNNPQLKLYGLSAYPEHLMLYDIRRIQTTITQPRLENISMEELIAEELLDRTERKVRPRAAQAYAGEGEFKVGDHRRFCKARVTYGAHTEYNLELMKLDFVNPALLADEEIGEVPRRADELDHRAKDVTGFALVEVLKGTKHEGWKLMEGASCRGYVDRDAIAMRLITEDQEEDEIYKPRELIGITEITKLIGKKKLEELLSGLVIKSEGEPTLAPEPDKRPELNGVAEAKQNLDNKMGKQEGD